MEIQRSSAQQARARQRSSFIMHLATYVLVCALLVAIDLVSGSAGETFFGLNWAFWPIMGWGIGIILHGLSLFRPPAGWEKAHG